MTILHNLWTHIKKFFIRNPAMVSGYIIYCYLFASIIHLFFKVKHPGITWSDAYDIFSALPFMWLLAVSFVKVIEYQALVHLKDQVLQIKNTQLRTMHEVAKGIQHQVNNPLAIISLSLAHIKRTVSSDAAATKKVETIEESITQITAALQKFAAAERYESEHVDDVVGTLASVSKES